MKLTTLFFVIFFPLAIAKEANHDVYFGGNYYAYVTGQPQASGRIYVLDPSGNARLFYEDRNNVESIHSSTNGEFVSALVVERISGERTLKVLSRSAKVLVSIKNVYRYAWGPLATSLVYVTGSVREGGRVLPEGHLAL